MKHLTRPQLSALRARAIAAGIDWDSLSPLLRVDAIVQPPRRSKRPPGLLPIAKRTWYDWVARKIVEPPITFENGVSAWPKVYIVTIALDGIEREPGHGRKLAGEGKRPPRRSTTAAEREGQTAAVTAQT